MTDISQLALKFAKECLGWKRAFVSDQEPVDTLQAFIDRGEYVKDSDNAFLFYNDLNSVLRHVRKWCELHSFGWSLGSADETQRVTATIYVDFVDIERPWDGGENDEDPCQALLAACIEAYNYLEKERKKEEKRLKKK